jgi:hypothetical protein
MNPLLAAIRLLAALTGTLRANAGATEAQLKHIRELIARCFFLGQTEPFFGTQDPLQLADIAELDAGELSQLRDICTSVQADLENQPGQVLDIRVFRREVPVTDELPEARPAWAAGAATGRSFGPFISTEHRPVWFTVYNTPPFVSLVSAAGGAPLVFLPHVDALQPATDFVFPAGSVWISAQLLAPEAPAGSYCGLRVSGANLQLDTLPTTDAGIIRMAAGTVMRLELRLDASEHPVDAAQGALHPGRIRAKYPTRLRLVTSPSGLQLESLSDAELSLFGTNVVLRFEPGTSPTYDQRFGRILVQYTPQAPELIAEAESSQFHISGVTKINRAAWALPVAQPSASAHGEASGAGELALILHAGLAAQWSNLPAPVRLRETQLFVEPTGSTLRATAVNDRGASQRFGLWPDGRSPQHRCSLQLDYRDEFPVCFRVEADSSETLALAATCLARFDRPVMADGTSVTIGPVSCRASLFSGAGAGPGLLVQHVALPPTGGVFFRPQSLPFALQNALLRATSFDALFLFGAINSAGDGLERGVVSLHFGIASVLPIFPDPYTANFESPREQPNPNAGARLSSRTRWAEPDPVPEFSLQLAPVNNEDPTLRNLFPSHLAPHPPEPRPSHDHDPEAQEEVLATQEEDNLRDRRLRTAFHNALLVGARESLLLLDVSSNADQFGVGLGLGRAEIPSSPPSQTLIRDRSLAMLARDVRVFTVPQIQWEPVWTIQNPDLADFPSPLASADDGGATVLGIDTVNLVPIDPGQVVWSLVTEFQRQDPSITAAALFTLPFGMKAVAAPLRHPHPLEPGAALGLVRPRDRLREITGGLQISLTAFDPLSTPERESPGFPGGTVQLRNGIDPGSGGHLGLSVLDDVENAFNAEFAPGSAHARVPVTRIDFSGYGASLYSRWQNPAAATAETSQVYLDVAVGRTAHEVVQVRSVLYPWGVRVVRTITIERTAGGGVFRRDSGWVAVSNGVFEFPSGSVVETHPGVVKGVFNVRRIRDTTHMFERSFAGINVRMAAVRFDADVRVSDVVVGESNGFVPSIDQVGFIQMAPSGTPLTPDQYAALLAAEGPIGGPVDCIIDIGRSGQKMRVTRVDVAAAGGIEFAAAARGSLLLPKDGQWSFVRQPVDISAECISADPHSGVPLVRQGKRTVPDTVNPAPYLLAEPADLFVPGRSGFNTALLWSMGMQRVLFARPHIPKDISAIRSVVPPLLADFFATAATSAVFPSTMSCLEIPFSNYSLDIIGESQFRLVLSAPTFAAQRVAGGLKRELSKGASIRTFADYTNTRFTVMLDSAASQSWSYEETGVAIVQERDGVHAKTSHGVFRASSTEAVRWILTREEFGDLFAKAKTLLPLLSTGISGPGTIPPGGGIVIPGTAMPPLTTAEGPNPKIGVRIEKEIPDKVPVFIGVTQGGNVEIIFAFERFFSLEVVVGILIAGIFPAGALLKFESETLRRSDTNVTAGHKLEFVLAIGIQVEGEFQALVPFPHRYNWKVFIGIGFATESGDGVGLGIIFQASGSVQYPGEVALVEVGVNVEGQGLVSFEDVDTFIVCKGSLSIEITVAFLLDIEWEITEGEIFKQMI